MKIVKLSTLNASEVLRLTTYLEKFSKETDKKSFVLAHLGNFFLNLTLEQNVALTDAISNDDKDAIEIFIKNNPDIDVNLDGDSKINDIPGWKVKEEALDSIYTLACNTKQKTSKLKQIIKARELTCLTSINPGDYDIERVLSKINESYPNSKLNTYISRLKGTIPIKKFLSKVFVYYRETKAIYFVKYVFFYLDVLMLDEKHESALSNNYIKAISEIVK